MIKINLLGASGEPPKPAPGTRVSMATQLGSLAGAVVVCFAIVGLLYKVWSGSIDALNVELRVQQAEQARLAAIKVENTKYDQERRELEQRITTINRLQADRVGPTEFMNALGSVVNRTRDVYLFSATPQGDRVVLHGQANSVDSVAGLLSSMKNSGYFDDVQLRQFYEDDVGNQISYKFNLDCGYKPPSAAASTTQAGAGGGNLPPSPRPRS